MDDSQDIPLGLCQCGCGERTKVAIQNRPEIGHVKGEPVRYRQGHHQRGRFKDRGPAPLCRCGCGGAVSWRGQTRGGWSLYAPGCYIGPKQKPRHSDWVDDGTGFWDWFAGFLDGEGFFGFLPRRFNRTYHTPVVRIGVRLDDREILDEIASRIGGTVRVQPAYGTSHPQARWSIGSIADCLRLIQILDAHPLRAKKARDYATWREAVLEKDREGNTERLDELVEKLIVDRRWNPDCTKGGDAK